MIDVFKNNGVDGGNARPWRVVFALLPEQRRRWHSGASCAFCRAILVVVDSFSFVILFSSNLFLFTFFFLVHLFRTVQYKMWCWAWRRLVSSVGILRAFGRRTWTCSTIFLFACVGRFYWCWLFVFRMEALQRTYTTDLVLYSLSFLYDGVCDLVPTGRWSPQASTAAACIYLCERGEVFLHTFSRQHEHISFSTFCCIFNSVFLFYLLYFSFLYM